MFLASLAVIAAVPPSARAACTPATLPTGIQIIQFFPANGGPGTPVIFWGIGFSQLSSGALAKFGGAGPFDGSAAISVVNDGELRTVLPPDAKTSPPSLTMWQSCTTVGGGQGGILRTLAQATDVLEVSDLPIPPTDEHAIPVSDQEIRLVWRDNSTNEDGFRIHIFDTPANRWRAPVDVLPDTTSYPVTGLVPSTRYLFYITNFNATGETHWNRQFDQIAATTFPAMSGRANVTVNNAPGLVHPLCNATPIWITAYFDQNGNGMIDGVTGSSGLSFPYPKYYEIGLWHPSGYTLRDGDAYARGIGTTANLAVTAVFECQLEAPLFVSAHFVLYYDSQGNLVVEGVRLLAGDLADPTGGFNERRGVVMEDEGFDGTVDPAIERTLRAVGQAYGTVAWTSPGGIPYGAQIVFDFDAPVETR